MTVDTLSDIDALADEIRRVDGNHSLGAGSLAEALQPFLRATIDGLRSERDEARTGLAVRLMKVRDALSVTTPILGGMRVTIHPARAAEYAATVDAAIAAITMAAPNYPLIERINKMLDDIGENFFAKDERTKGTLMPLLRDCRASLTTARADGIEVERLREALRRAMEGADMLCRSVRSVLVELKPGQSLHPAGAGKTNILESDVNAVERMLRALSPPANEPAKDETEVTG